MLVVDTNVFVYAVNSDAPEHERCRTLLGSWRCGAEPWGTTWGVLYEFLRVATHPRASRSPLAAPQAWSFVESMLAAPSFRVLTETDRHAEFVALTLAEVPPLSGNIFHDAHTAVLMREHGVRVVYTRDAHFHRFPFLEVRDPMAPLGR